jgi:phosphatidylglycerophosphatase A
MKIYKIIASGFGSGYSPYAPGTAGSVVGIGLMYLFNFWLVSMGVSSPGIIALNSFAIVLITFAGILSIEKVHTIWPHDASKIVIDEIAGVWVTALALPLDWHYYLYALIIFRFFDIVKPLYIRKIDNMKNDWSVMLDDLLAGFYGFIVLQFLINMS